ncbi:hypothetical protein AX15_007910, partial [Amanita polypyramis BW_CC]
MSLQLNCLIEGEDIVFLVTAVSNDAVSDLKNEIKRQCAVSFEGIDARHLELWKPKGAIEAEPEETLVERIGPLGHDFSKFAVKLGSSKTVFSIFPTQPPRDYIHIIIKVPHIILKRKRDDPTDISRKLFDLWTKPAKWDLQHLKEYLEKPLDPDWKIPLRHAEWRAFLVTESIPAHACSAEDLELL